MHKGPILHGGRLTTPREDDASRFKECSSRKRAFSPKGKSLFTLLNDKSIGKVIVLRKMAKKIVFSREREHRVNFQEVDMGIELFL